MPHFNSRDRCSTGPFLDAPLRLTLRSRVATTRVIIIGGGLAGSEAAWQAARRGLRVDLHEMRPVRTTPVHATGDLAELVCSNSLKSNLLDTASGLLKEEMRRCDSLIIRVADACRVPAGGALAVDRERFARGVTEAIESLPQVRVLREEARAIPDEGSCDARIRPDEAGRPRRPSHRQTAVRRRATPAGQPGGRLLLDGRLPESSQVRRADPGVPDDPRPRARGISAPRPGAPQLVHQR